MNFSLTDQHVFAMQLFMKLLFGEFSCLQTASSVWDILFFEKSYWIRIIMITII